MIKHFRHILIIGLLGACFSTSVIAQNGGFAGAASRLGFGPRGISMANAFSASTSEGIYPYYNPALAAETVGFNQLDLAVSSLEFDRVYQNLGANFKLPPNAGISFGIIRSGVKDIDERTLSGYPLGNFDVSEYQIFTTFGIKFSNKFNAGIGFKLNYANYHEDLQAATAVGIDFGILYKISQKLNAAFVIQDMFANYTWNSSELYGLAQSRNVVNTFPTRFKWSLSYETNDFAVAGEYEIQSYLSERINYDVFVQGTTTSIIETTEEISTSSGIFRMGGSWKAHKRFSLRGGYRFSDLTNSNSGSLSTGFSVYLPFDALSPSIDYAFVIEPYQVANMHVFALRLHL